MSASAADRMGAGLGYASPWNALFVVPAVTPIAGHDGEGDRLEPRPGRSGCRRGPRSTSRSSPRAPQRAPSQPELWPRPAGRARREHPGPGSRSSPSARAGGARARRPRATPGRGRTPARDRPAGRTPGRWPGRAGHGRSGGCGPGRWGAAGSGCSERPCHHSSITLSDPGGLKRTHAVPPLCAAIEAAARPALPRRDWAFCAPLWAYVTANVAAGQQALETSVSAVLRERLTGPCRSPSTPVRGVQ